MSGSDAKPDVNSIEKISPGNTVEIRHARQILIYTLTDFSKPNHIDAYYDRAIEDIGRFFDTKTILCVHDVSGLPFTWTPHIRSRAIELIQRGQQLKGGRVALIFRKSAFLRLIRVFIEWQQSHSFPHIEIQVFFDRETGIAWVEEGLGNIENTKRDESSAS